jgi:hypothetical protein
MFSNNIGYKRNERTITKIPCIKKYVKIPFSKMQQEKKSMRYFSGVTFFLLFPLCSNLSREFVTLGGEIPCLSWSFLGDKISRIKKKMEVTFPEIFKPLDA